MALTEITTKSIKDGEIVNADINASADIAGSKIADNAITLAKMAGGTDGHIITYDASGDPITVGPGNDGEVLTSTGAGSPPAFEAIPTQISLANDANNRVITGTGSGLNGEANLTFDGSKLDVTSPSTAANDSEPIAVFTTQGHCQVRLDGDGNKWSLVALDSAAAGDHFIIYDKNNSTERLRIHSNGRISSGTTSADARLHLKSPDGGNDAIILDQTTDAANYQNQISFKNAGTQYAGIVGGKDGSNNNLGIVFHTGTSSTERLRIQAGGGISFNGDTAAANALDDFEEGSWVPDLRRSGSQPTMSYSYRTGKYTKIGNIVFMWFDIQVSSESGGTGGWQISLPFTFVSGSSNGGHGVAVFRDSNMFGRLNMANSSSYVQQDYIGIAYINSSGTEVSATSSGSGRCAGQVWGYVS